MDKESGKDEMEELPPSLVNTNKAGSLQEHMEKENDKMEMKTEGKEKEKDKMEMKTEGEEQEVGKVCFDQSNFLISIFGMLVFHTFISVLTLLFYVYMITACAKK